MPEHLRALLIIILLSISVFAVFRKAAVGILDPYTYSRWRNLWLATTFIAFLAHDYWIYIILTSSLLILLGRAEKNRIGLLFCLVFAVPIVTVEIPGFGLIGHFFSMSHLRMLSIVLLLPMAIILGRSSDVVPFFRYWPDKLIVVYLITVIVLGMRETSVTDGLRQGLYLGLEVLLPYYTISRAIKSVNDFRESIFALVLAGLVLAAIGYFEFSRHWLLYKPLIGAFGLEWGYLHYLGRSNSLRASATTGQAIALGYLMVVCIGFYIYLAGLIHDRWRRRIGGALFALGLIAPLSRGPWIGAAALFAAYVITGPMAAKRLMLMAAGGLASLALIPLFPGGEKVVDMLPFMGTVDRFNIDYRNDLIGASINVIERNPLFGSSNYLASPELNSLRQSSGFVDLVNTYLGITLEYGLFGLAIFLTFFVSVAVGVYSALHKLGSPNSEEGRLGRVLLAVLVAIMVIISTVSSITIIPFVYWSVAGLGVAYAEMVKNRMRGVSAMDLCKGATV